ncbi:hypothetical protein BD770DRAFT_450178, partial [Pilaira anomala]
MSLVLYKPRGIELVETIYNAEERIADTKDNRNKSKDDNSRGRFRQLSNQDSGNLQQIQHQRNISTHSRSDEYKSGYAESNQKTFIRIHDSETVFSNDSIQMGENEDRRICSETQLPITNVLVTFNRSRSSSSGCDETNMAEKGDVPISTMENDSSGIKINTETEIESNSISDINVAKPILVSNDPKDEAPTTADNLEDKSKMVLSVTGESGNIWSEFMTLSRLAIINNKRLQDGLDQETIDYLNKKWCKQQEPNLIFTNYEPKNVLLFLQHNHNFSRTHFNTLRSSIASVFAVLHADHLPIAEQPLIKDFFVAKRNSDVRIPNEQQLVTWDISILFEYVKQHLSLTSSLSLEQVQLKTILLLCMATMWRPRSDIGRLQYRDVILKKNEDVSSIRIHARIPKEGQVKSITLGQNEDEDL